jgi:RimJ/RimL family protein N-acetyltransferase
VFTPIATSRLVLRQVRVNDAISLAERRSDPQTAEFQSWEVPYPLDRAQRLIGAVLEMDGPTDDEWYLIAVADPETDEMLGDLAVFLKWEGRTARIGYTFDPAARGVGYATEAVEALLGYLFEDGDVFRVEAVLHPGNVASARLLERTGFRFEAHTRSDYWVGSEVTDSWHYALLRSDYDDWRRRPRREPDEVGLMEIEPGTGRQALALATHKTQEAFVAPMAASFSDALFPAVFDGIEVVPWMRLVVADGEPVGFVMVSMAAEHRTEPYLWRLLIDRRHQRRGIGRRVLDEVVRQCRTWGEPSLLTSWAEGRGSPGPFYTAYGFEPTGRVVEGEVEGRFIIA